MASTAPGMLSDHLDLLRDGVIWKASDLPDDEMRRALTPSGTNLLGLLKHLAACEYGWFQMCFARPVPPLAFLAPDANPADDFVATPDETPEHLLAVYRDAVDASRRTVAELGPDAIGHVPWWEDREVTVLEVLAHMTVETARHLGHMDIVREQLDGRTGLGPGR